jgi:polyhydroxyalkanoate synthesis regulator phasin
MWKTKKFLILVPVMAVILLLGVTVGVALAKDGANPKGPGQDILARVAQILGIDEQKLTDAFKQAQAEFEAQRLNKLVEEGKITQEQADQLKAWEAAMPDSKADPQAFDEWLKSKPDMPFLEPPGSPPHQNMDEMLAELVEEGKITQEQADQLKTWEAAMPDSKADPQAFDEWLKSRPDVPLELPGSPFPPCNGQPPAPQTATTE